MLTAWCTSPTDASPLLDLHSGKPRRFDAAKEEAVSVPQRPWNQSARRWLRQGRPQGRGEKEVVKLSPGDVLRVMEEMVPFNRLLGLRGESASEGRCVLRLPVRGDLVGDPRRPAIHGGV